jgi:hypothetical protein
MGADSNQDYFLLGDHHFKQLTYTRQNLPSCRACSAPAPDDEPGGRDND